MGGAWEERSDFISVHGETRHPQPPCFQLPCFRPCLLLRQRRSGTRGKAKEIGTKKGYSLSPTRQRLSIARAIAKGEGKHQGYRLPNRRDERPGSPANLRIALGSCRRILATITPQLTSSHNLYLDYFLNPCLPKAEMSSRFGRTGLTPVDLTASGIP